MPTPESRASVVIEIEAEAHWLHSKLYQRYVERESPCAACRPRGCTGVRMHVSKDVSKYQKKNQEGTQPPRVKGMQYGFT